MRSRHVSSAVAQAPTLRSARTHGLVRELDERLRARRSKFRGEARRYPSGGLTLGSVSVKGRRRVPKPGTHGTRVSTAAPSDARARRVERARAARVTAGATGRALMAVWNGGRTSDQDERLQRRRGSGRHLQGRNGRWDAGRAREEGVEGRDVVASVRRHFARCSSLVPCVWGGGGRCVSAWAREAEDDAVRSQACFIEGLVVSTAGSGWVRLRPALTIFLGHGASSVPAKSCSSMV